MFDKICLQGGGVLGSAYGGAFEYLYEKGHYDNITEISGTSAGALAGIMLSMKVPGNIVTKELSDINFSHCLDSTWNPITQIAHVLSNFGWYHGKVMEETLGKLIEKYAGDSDITFGRLQDKFDNKLHITGSNISTQRPVYFSVDTDPEMSVLEAGMISSSIPFIFGVKRYNDDVYVDGGLYDNIPLEPFRQYDPSRYVIMGFDDTLVRRTPSTKINSPFKFVSALVKSVIFQAGTDHISAVDKKRAIIINDLDIDSFNFDIKNTEKFELRDQGYLATQKFVESDQPS
jgi:NTE family protein